MKLSVCLRLARASNLPTITSNVLAGLALSGATPGGWRLTRILVGMSALYAAGMFLNDACDHRSDAARRADRPIPTGEVSLLEAIVAGIALLLLGVRLLAVNPQAGLAAMGLCAGILVFDLWHRGNAAAPLLIAGCRAMVYVGVALAARGALGWPVLAGAALLFVYVLALSWWSRIGGMYVSGLIAGISLVDAALLCWAGAAGNAVLALLCFIATLRFQRLVPGV